MLAPLSILVAAAASGTPLAPVTPWDVQYAARSCIAARDFGGTAKAPQVAFALRPLPLDGGGEMIFAVVGQGSVPAKGALTLSLAPTGRSMTAVYVARRDADGRLVVRFAASKEIIEALGQAQSLSVTIAGRTVVHIQTAAADRALAALRPCQDDLLKTWGMDPTQSDRVGTPAVALGGGQAAWMSSFDYSGAALRDGSAGATTVAFTVGTDGRVRDCRLLASSGVTALDGTACAVFVRRGRYRAALDKAGKPMDTYQVKRVDWTLF